MDKSILSCMLEKKYINQIRTFCKTNHCTYSELFKLILEDFLKSYNKNQKIVLKENNFDRIKLNLFAFSVFTEYRNEIEALAKKHNLHRAQIVRELLVGYLKKNKLKI